jgi:hypothetical protein
MRSGSQRGAMRARPWLIVRRYYFARARARNYFPPGQNASGASPRPAWTSSMTSKDSRASKHKRSSVDVVDQTAGIGAQEPRSRRTHASQRLPLPDIGSHANALGGKCLRQHEGRARGRAIQETPYSPRARPASSPCGGGRCRRRPGDLRGDRSRSRRRASWRVACWSNALLRGARANLCGPSTPAPAWETKDEARPQRA